MVKVRVSVKAFRLGEKKEIKLFLFTDDTVLNTVHPNIHVTKTYTHTQKTLELMSVPKQGCRMCDQHTQIKCSLT